MKLKRCLALLLMAAILGGLLCACSTDEVSTSLAGFSLPEQMKTIKSGVAAENDRVSLSWDMDTTSLQLKDKVTGEIWSTIPYGYYQSGSTGSNYVQNGLRSSLYITYEDGEKHVEMENNSFRHAQYITAQKIEGGVQLTYYFSKAEISVPVRYTLEEDGMSATVDVKNITEGKYKILSVSVLPFFCSAENTAENYLFVPSGSGALMMTDDVERSTRRYSEQVYGVDAATTPVFRNTAQNTVRLPVFGAKNGSNAMLAAITSGAEMATVNAVAGDAQYGYSAAYATFALRGLATTYTGNSWGGANTVKQYSADVINVDPSVRYILLDKKNADYNGMAAAYRAYLKNTAGLKEGVGTPDLMLTMLGGVPVRKLFMGIPYETMSVMTSFADAQSILSDLQTQTGASMTVNLKGFGSTGLEAGELGGGFKADSAFGGQKALNALTDWCENNKVDSFLDYDLVFYRDSGNGFSVRDSAITAAMIRATCFDYDIVTHQQTGDAMYLANRYAMAKSAQKVAELTKKQGTTGVSISTLSSTAYSDYDSRNYYCKAHMSDDVQRMIKALNAAGLKTFGEEANAYAAVKLDYIYDTPTESSGFFALDMDIPFYQMVFKGSVGLSGGAINLAQDPRTAFLKTVATGSSLGYTLCGSAERDVLLGNHSAVGSSIYSGLSEQIVEYMVQAQPLLDKVRTASIVSYEKNGNVSRTEFDNGVVLYVNYGLTAERTELGTLDALSFHFN
jgi:hypothetical protein